MLARCPEGSVLLSYDKKGMDSGELTSEDSTFHATPREKPKGNLPMITRRILPLGAGIALLSVPAFHAAASNEVLPFEDAMLSVVYSASDDDAQILIRATGVDPIGQVHIVGPGGTVRLKAKFRDGDRLGQADVQFDTPEPSLEDLMRAYPEGVPFSGQNRGRRETRGRGGAVL